MFSKIISLFSGNAPYTLSVILFATATCYVLKIILEEIIKLYKLWHAAKTFPGPRGLPLLGIALDVVGDAEYLLKQLLLWSKRYPSPVCGWLGPKLIFIISDPESIKELLEKQRIIEKPSFHVFLETFFGNGLLTVSAKEWRVHRRLVTSVLNNRELLPYGEFFAEKAQEMVKEMEVELDGKGFEIRDFLTSCTLRMIFGVILGTSLKFESENLRNFHNDISRLVDTMLLRISRIWLYPDVIFNRTALGQKHHQLVERLTTMIETAWKQVEAEENCATGNGRREDETLTGLYMKLPRNRDNFTQQDFLYELNTILSAGSHTLTSQMDFLMRMLAYNPDIQDKVYDELYGIYGSTDPADRPVMREDLSRLEYLECAIHESMRLFPAVPIVVRDIARDMNIGSCVLPEGSAVLVGILNMHRSEKYWANPLKFDPDRFLPENNAKRVPGTFIPFSSGPRHCIGDKYAMIAAKILSATLLRRYVLRADTVVPVENIRLQANIVMESIEPWKLRIEERNPGKTGT